MPNRRSSDTITDKLVNEVANNGHTVKQLVARMHLENKLEHKEIFTMLKFHNWYIKTSIGVLVTGVIGGLIVVIFRLCTGG